MAWYCRTHNKKAEPKRAAEFVVAAPPAAKKAATQALLFGASVPAAAAAASAPPPAPAAAAAAGAGLAKPKRAALLKGLLASLKAAAKAKKWHAGDCETLSASVVMDSSEFAALFDGVAQISASGGVLSTLSLSAAALSALFGEAINKLSVPTHSRPRAFAKGYKTGSALLAFSRADGKFSRGTSTLTLKFAASVDGGCGEYGGWGCDW